MVKPFGAIGGCPLPKTTMAETPLQPCLGRMKPPNSIPGTEIFFPMASRSLVSGHAAWAVIWRRGCECFGPWHKHQTHSTLCNSHHAHMRHVKSPQLTRDDLYLSFKCNSGGWCCAYPQRLTSASMQCTPMHAGYFVLELAVCSL